jgi:creatinine amidohydrolase
MAKRTIILLVIAAIVSGAALQARQTVKDLPFHELQNFCWMRLAKVVPEVTDRVILPIGTVESHGACALGTDNVIPQRMAELIWEKCNALMAPPINHGVTSVSIARFPGAIRVRPEVFEEYIYDVLKELVRTGFRNVLIVNGHGGNTDPVKNAMNRLHLETGARFMVVDWWTTAFNVVNEVYGQKAQQSGHGDMEEAALAMASDPKLVDREMYEKLGRDNVGRAGTDAGVVMVPGWATSRYPEKGLGYLDFDLGKANEYMRRKADFVAETFLEAVRRWEMMEVWKK